MRGFDPPTSAAHSPTDSFDVHLVTVLSGWERVQHLQHDTARVWGCVDLVQTRARLFRQGSVLMVQLRRHSLQFGAAGGGTHRLVVWAEVDAVAIGGGQSRSQGGQRGNGNHGEPDELSDYEWGGKEDTGELTGRAQWRRAGKRRGKGSDGSAGGRSI